MTVTVRRSAGLGDAIAATVVAEALYKSGHSVVFQCGPLLHPLIRLCPFIKNVADPVGQVHIQLDGCYENHPMRATSNFHNLFLASAHRQASALGIDMEACDGMRPRLVPHGTDRLCSLSRMSKYSQPWIFICPRSNYNVRQIPTRVIAKVAQQLDGTCFWLADDPAPPNTVDLHIRDLVTMATFLSVADLLITCDTGPMHIATALEVPVVTVGQAFDPKLRLPIRAMYTVIYPELECLNCQKHQCPISTWSPPCQNIDPNRIIEESRKMLTVMSKKPELSS